MSLALQYLLEYPPASSLLFRKSFLTASSYMEPCLHQPPLPQAMLSMSKASYAWTNFVICTSPLNCFASIPLLSSPPCLLTTRSKLFTSLYLLSSTRSWFPQIFAVLASCVDSDPCSNCISSEMSYPKGKMLGPWMRFKGHGNFNLHSENRNVRTCSYVGRIKLSGESWSPW